jgi:hypothetical protein
MRAERLDTALEKLIGPLLGEAMAGSWGTDEDPLLAPWVRRIGAQVAAFSPRDDLKPRFSVLASDVANALALPGGQIFVTRGLLETVGSDDELAGVLAHEVGHVARRHALKHLGENGLGIALLSLLGSRDLRVLGKAANALRGLARSRQLESQADAIGLELAAAAGYDPRGLLRFLESISGAEPSKLEAYLLTHPTPQQRLSESRKSPLVARLSEDDREALAASLEARGLVGQAAEVRAGRDPLTGSGLVVTGTLPPPLATEREAVIQQAAANLRELTGAFKAQRVGGTLHQLLLLNGRPGEPGWLVLAARAWGLYNRLLDGYVRSVRTLRDGPATWDALGRMGDEESDAALGRAEAAEAIARAGRISVPLAHAARAALGVLADLNLRLGRLDRRQQWLRYGALEGVVRYAESELERVEERSGQAQRLLSLARLRRYRDRLTRLAPAGSRLGREIFADRLAARVGVGVLLADEPAGPASLRRALARQLNRPEVDLAGPPGSDWIASIEKEGVPENVALVLRLLILELERELRSRHNVDVG